MHWLDEKPKYRVVDYGPRWWFVVERFSFGLPFGWRWRPVKVFDFENWQGIASKYCNGDTVEEALQHLREHLREHITMKTQEKGQAAARRSFAKACSEAKKTVVLDEFNLE